MRKYGNHTQLHKVNDSVLYQNTSTSRFLVQMYFINLFRYVTKENVPKVQHFNQVSVHNVYLAPFNHQYYRGRVDAIDFKQGSVTVFFIDFGNVEDVAIDELVVITRKGLLALGDSALPLVKVN